LLTVRAFSQEGAQAEGVTFTILKGLDWSVVQGARIINMSFAGPADPAMHRSLDAASAKGIVLIAAAGNAGPKSPPLFPGADPDTIAVTATDVDDKIYAAANSGSYIALAAPGVDVLVAAPGGAYEVASGTSFAAAEISGIAALLLQQRASLATRDVRAILRATAHAVGQVNGVSQGIDLADAYRALAMNKLVASPVAPLAK
jgi:subtilisin family serine protease